MSSLRTVALTLLALVAACSNDEVETDEPVVDCSTRPLQVPSARGEVSGVWDEAGQRFVFFGGDAGRPVDCFPQTAFTDETWAFHLDCDNFERLDIAAPPPRGRHAAALDATRGRMIVHGGRYRDGTSGTYTLLDDTWAFDLATDTWTKLSDSGPGARTNHVIGVAGDKLLLFGGNTSTSGTSFRPMSDLWSLDLGSNTWSKLTPANAGPDARLFHVATASDDGSAFYVFGGGDEGAFTGGFYTDLWALDTQSLEWTMLHAGTSGAPVGRIWGNLLFDGNRLLSWAGHEDNMLGNSNTLWSFDLSGRTWSQDQVGDVLQGTASGFCDFPADFVTPDLDMPERRNAGAGALTPDGQLVIFGGKTDCGIINDLWTLDLASGVWTDRSRATEGEICQRAFQQCDAMCF